MRQILRAPSDARVWRGRRRELGWWNPGIRHLNLWR